MAVYNKDSRLSEVVMAHPSIIPVINRLGVSLGVVTIRSERCVPKGASTPPFYFCGEYISRRELFPV